MIATIILCLALYYWTGSSELVAVMAISANILSSYNEAKVVADE